MDKGQPTTHPLAFSVTECGLYKSHTHTIVLCTIAFKGSTPKTCDLRIVDRHWLIVSKGVHTHHTLFNIGGNLKFQLVINCDRTKTSGKTNSFSYLLQRLSLSRGEIGTFMLYYYFLA